MKLNNSFTTKDYYSQTAHPSHPVNRTIQYGSNDYNLSQTRPDIISNYNDTKKRAMSNTRGPHTYNFTTVDHNNNNNNNNYETTKHSSYQNQNMSSPRFINNLHFQYNQTKQPTTASATIDFYNTNRMSQGNLKNKEKRHKSKHLLQERHDIVNQTIQPYYNEDKFQSIQVNNFTKGSKDALNFDKKYHELERALSYNIMKAHKTIQQVEQECEIRLIEEKKRFKEKENDNKQKIKQLVNKIENEKDKRLSELTNITELKRKNLDLRKRISELIFENNQLSVQNQQHVLQVNSLQKQNDSLNSQYTQLQQHQSHSQQKFMKKLLKRESKIDELQDIHEKDLRRLQKELSLLQQQNKDLEFELFSYKKQGSIVQQDQIAYEDRIKQLLIDLENQSKKYIHEINMLHDHSRSYVLRCGELEEKIKVIQIDYDQAIESERNVRKENVRLKLQNDELIKTIQRQQQTIQIKKQEDNKTCQRCIQMMQTIQFSEQTQQINNLSTIQQDIPQKPHQQNKIQDQQKQQNNQIDNKSPQNQKQNTKKPKPEQSQQEQQVLSNLVDNIQQNTALCNGHIRRIFSLQNILFKGNKLISKNQMMDELSEYENLIRAMGALFFTSKRMSDQVPCIFQAWKEYSFEMKAKKIRNLLSESQIKQTKQNGKQQSNNNNNNNFDSINQRDLSGTHHFKQELGSQGMTIHYDQNHSEDYYGEDHDDMNGLEEEEFMKVENSNQSYSILPANNLKANDLRHDSQYEDGEDEDISIDNDDDDDVNQQDNQEEQKQKWEFNEDDPEVQNAKLLEKYAQMQGVTMDQMMMNLNEADDAANPNGIDNNNLLDDQEEQMVFVDEEGREIDHQTLMMMMNQEGLIQGPDGQFYYQGQDDDDDEEDNDNDQDQDEEEEDLVYQDIITADDYINDDEEAQAKFIQEKQRLKEKILHQPSTSQEGSAQRKKTSKKINQLTYYEEMDDDGNLYLFEKQ